MTASTRTTTRWWTSHLSPPSSRVQVRPDRREDETGRPAPCLSSPVFCLADPAVVHALLDKCHDHLRAYLKKDIPDELHYKNNVRIQPILLIADEGWTIVQRGDLSKCTAHF